MNNRVAYGLFAFAIVAIATCACSEKKASHTVRGGLPTVSTETDCAEDSGSSLDACEWILSTDSIVYGTLIGARLVDDYCIRYRFDGGTSPFETIDTSSCQGSVRPALELIVDVQTAIHGQSLEGKVAVRMGYSASQHQGLGEGQKFTVVDGDNINWNCEGPDYAGCLHTGQGLGLALHRIDAIDGWSVAREPMFILDGGGITFQKTAGCNESPPAGLQGKSLVEFADLADRCADDPPTVHSAAGSRKARVTSAATNTYAALCDSSGEEVLRPFVDCKDDSDCAEGIRCLENTCQSACGVNGRCPGSMICHDGHCKGSHMLEDNFTNKDLR